MGNKRETYYISTGEKTAMYTLRVQYMGIDGWGHPAIMDDYICNLSTDADKALSKATAYVEQNAEGQGVKFTGFSLDEIKRRAAGVAKAEQEAADAARWEEEENRRVAREAAGLQLVTQGKFPFGKYREELFEVAPKSYVKYIAENFVAEEGDKVVEMLLVELKRLYPEAFVEMPKPNGKHVDAWAEKEKVEFKATVIAAFGYEGYYGWVDVTKFVKDSGELIVHSGTRNFDIEEGDIVVMKGTVKAFDEYDDENQTLIIRPKLLERNSSAA